MSEDLVIRLEKTIGIKRYIGISKLSFNSTHNRMAKNEKLYTANKMGGIKLKSNKYNGESIVRIYIQTQKKY